MRKPWTLSEIEILRRRYADEPTTRIARDLRRSVKKIYSKAAQLGLKKSAAYLASPDACRLRRGDGVGVAYRFRKGHVPANLGAKGICYPGCVPTQFKPGNRSGRAAERHQPVGTTRISKDGYIQIKINDDMPLHKRWRGLHIVQWEAINGPLPASHALVFRDGNKQNTALENLELITRAELMTRNSYHRYGKEIAALHQLRGALTRQINRRSKHV
jgi:hypothetical protein